MLMLMPIRMPVMMVVVRVMTTASMMIMARRSASLLLLVAMLVRWPLSGAPRGWSGRSGGRAGSPERRLPPLWSAWEWGFGTDNPT